MERKIGEIFEYNGEWYQCVNTGLSCNDCDIKGDCSDTFIGTCSRSLRKDGKPVRFKKLEKVGEPYEYFVQGAGIIMVQEYIIYNQKYIRDAIQNLYIFDCQNGRIAIEVKQNQEDMEENKMNLKPFDLEAAKAGKPVCTRDGRKARIICFDRDWDMRIVALVSDPLGESVHYYLSNGKVDFDKQNDEDLMMLPERKEGWVNVYKYLVYDTKDEALIGRSESRGYIDTIKINWSE